MKIMVGYNGGEAGRLALCCAGEYARLCRGFVYVITSMKGGSSEKPSDITRTEKSLAFARRLLEQSGVQCDTQQSVRGLPPGEDLAAFAMENKIDHIFLGLPAALGEKKTPVGNTVRQVISQAPCPVTTVKFDLKSISDTDLLKGRTVLVADDEPDILETVEELLDMCLLESAQTFEQAEKALSENTYDVVILDIMGINGFALLEIARKKDLPALMLTAHALNPLGLKQSIEKGADAYIPKDELANLTDYVADVIKTRIQGRQGQGVWFKILKPFFDNSFGKGWREPDRAFWNFFDDKYGG